MICTSSKCDSNAFICFVKECECHVKAHKGCECFHLSTIISAILEKKRKVPPELEKVFHAIDRIYEEVLDKLSADREEVRKKM